MAGVETRIDDVRSLGSTDAQGRVSCKIKQGWSGTVSILIKPGDTFLRQSVRIPAGLSRCDLVYRVSVCRVTGRVLDSECHPVKRAVVRIEGLASPRKQSLVSAAQGIANDVGEYDLTYLRHEGGEYSLGAVGDDCHIERLIPLPALEEFRTDVMLVRNAVLAGAVTSRDGQPIAGAVGLCVYDRGSGDYSACRFTTDNKGVFGIGCKAGQLFVTVAAKGYARRTIDLGKLEASQRTPLAIVLDAGQRLEGSVIDERGQRVASVTLRFALEASDLPHAFQLPGDELVDEEILTTDTGTFTAVSLSGQMQYSIVTPVESEWSVVSPTRMEGNTRAVTVVLRKKKD